MIAAPYGADRSESSSPGALWRKPTEFSRSAPGGSAQHKTPCWSPASQPEPAKFVSPRHTHTLQPLATPALFPLIWMHACMHACTQLRECTLPSNTCFCERCRRPVFANIPLLLQPRNSEVLRLTLLFRPLSRASLISRWEPRARGLSGGPHSSRRFQPGGAAWLRRLSCSPTPNSCPEPP